MRMCKACAYAHVHVHVHVHAHVHAHVHKACAQVMCKECARLYLLPSTYYGRLECLHGMLRPLDRGEPLPRRREPLPAERMLRRHLAAISVSVSISAHAHSHGGLVMLDGLTNLAAFSLSLST